MDIGKRKKNRWKEKKHKNCHNSIVKAALRILFFGSEMFMRLWLPYAFYPPVIAGESRNCIEVI